MTFGSSNLSLHATLPLNGVGDTEWRLNDSKITNNQDGFLLSTTTRSHTKQIKLQVSSFNAGLHVGTYSLLITTVSGKYIVAHWKVVLPGKHWLSNNFQAFKTIECSGTVPSFRGHDDTLY